MNTAAIIQYGVLDALIADASPTGVPAATARRWGSFGIGCCDGLSGEVILLDGAVLECTDAGPPRPMRHDESLPFLEVCTFPDVPAHPVSAAGFAALDRAIEDVIPSENLPCAVRVDGVVRTARLRVPRSTGAPYSTLSDAARGQVEFEVIRIPGTLVGFWIPELYQGIAVAGLHLHFLADDRSVGGHVLDVSLTDATLRVAAFARFDLRLPVDEVFLAAHLSHEADARIAELENG